MSSLTDEWHLKRENGIKYWIDIRGFNKKMNWPCGKRIYSKKFKISESIFRIEIYPNGITSKETGHVSVNLCNDSNWRVRCSDVKISLKQGQHVGTLTSDYYKTDGSWGLPRFVSHLDIEEENLLGGDGSFTLEMDLEILEEEVASFRPVDGEGDALLSLKNEVSTIKEALDDQRTEIENMKELLNKILKILVAKPDTTRLPTAAAPSATVSP